MACYSPELVEVTLVSDCENCGYPRGDHTHEGFCPGEDLYPRDKEKLLRIQKHVTKMHRRRRGIHGVINGQREGDGAPRGLLRQVLDGDSDD